MIEIKEKQELKVVNAFSYRGKIGQLEIESVGKDMETYVH